MEETLLEPTKTSVKIRQPQLLTESQRPYAHKVWLPSGGNLYDGKFPGGEVTMVPMSVQQEKILTKQTKDRTGVLDTVIRQCIVECPVDYNDLLVGDMFYALFQLRNISYGAAYKFNLKCPCGTSFLHTINLPEGLEVRGLTEDDPDVFYVQLPMEKKNIGLRLLRVKDEVDIRNYSRQQHARNGVNAGDPAFIYRIAKFIVSIDGDEVPNMLRAMDFVGKLFARDSDAIRAALKKHDFGANLEIDTECPSCGGDIQQKMELNANFFRANDRDSAE